MSEFRLRVGFSKLDRAALLSHLELLHAIERIVRRAQLPYAITQGFHPHMKLAFGPALSVGVASTLEYADVYLTEFVNPDVALARLRDASPEALKVERVGYINPKEASLTASITILSYCARVHALDIDAKEIEKCFSELRKSDTLEVVQKDKVKVFNPALCIPNDAQVTKEGDSTHISFNLRISPSGSLRPEILLTTVFEQAHAHYSHLTLTRTGLYSESEEGLVPPL